MYSVVMLDFPSMLCMPDESSVMCTGEVKEKDKVYRDLVCIVRPCDYYIIIKQIKLEYKPLSHITLRPQR